MNEKGEKQLLKLGKKHAKFLEDTSVNREPYVINNHRYYLVTYQGLFSSTDKGNAIISPDTNNREEAEIALYFLAGFSISWNNVAQSVGERAQVDFSILEEVEHYLKTVLNSGVLSDNDQTIYDRSLSIIQNMLTLQEEMKQLWKEAQKLEVAIQEKKAISDSDVDQLLLMNVQGGWIQYVQFKDRYTYRQDFDVIHANHSRPEIQQFERFSDPRTLENMTSEAAADQLKGAIQRLTEHHHPMDKDEYINHFYSVTKERLIERVEQMKKTLRHP
ncbi:hypothetical protein JNUCC1_03074 [Lentibacillus sp. JNUCC-1]|uniref:hypothetical protein n=1 Tax=Lentibacillus sp. JNUCC-1 TaxID=2654513 RepID=UPI0012E71480|nr:hypothetical protein [Lentibacillus sp. JNUCC-1]MUV39201.1 hypothetical protein [Lentibacillus sp. JNUCC-1]